MYKKVGDNMERSLGAVLKELRKKKKLTAKETADELCSMGYEISDKTLSGYETGIRMPNADVFMALCKIYDCKNILEMFSFINADYSIPTDDEWNMIEKYRFISTHSPDGAKVVDTILNREYYIAEQLKQATSTIIEMPTTSDTGRLIEYYRSVSAGTGQIIFDDVYSERITIPNNPKYRCVAYAVKVNGHSMEPIYSDGDILLIEPTCEIAIDEIGIFNVGGQAYVKKLGHGELISLNKDYENIKLTEESSCMGRVVDKL